jgi:DNA repair protein RadC
LARGYLGPLEALSRRDLEPLPQSITTQKAKNIRLPYPAAWWIHLSNLQKAIRRGEGTLTQTSVYPREIVKSALAANAAAVVFAHNHPSGVAQPSQSDELLTRNLKEALVLVEVKVLDHFIVAGRQAISFAERGLL